MLKLFKKSPQRMQVYFGPFKGAWVFLNPANSKRKLLGIYEHVLNDWIKKTASNKNFIFDVGANNGYDTYGLAFLASKGNTRPANIISIEPGADKFPELILPKDWPEYSLSKIEIIKKFAGSENNSLYTTLDGLYEERPNLSNKRGLVKIDVEGEECNVLRGSSKLLKVENVDWLVEIHGKELIPKVSDYFCNADRPFLIKELSIIPFLSKECRKIKTYWLITI